jgi:hypothetical protein
MLADNYLIKYFSSLPPLPPGFKAIAVNKYCISIFSLFELDCIFQENNDFLLLKVSWCPVGVMLMFRTS